MKKEVLKTTKAAAPVGPYSHVVRYGDLIFLSGVAPENAQTGETIHGTIAEQTEAVMSTIKAILEDVGSSMGQVIKTTIHMTKPEYFKEMNEVYAKYFDEKDGYPARITTFDSKIYDDLDLEIDVIAGIE